MKSLENKVGLYKKEMGTGFEEEIRDLTKKYINIVDHGKLKDLGKKWNIVFEEDREFDILAIIPSKHKILVVECKDWKINFDIREIKREIKKFEGKDGEINKHIKRCQAIERNLGSILEYYSINKVPEFSVIGLFVTRNVKFTNYLTLNIFNSYDTSEYEQLLLELIEKEN